MFRHLFLALVASFVFCLGSVVTCSADTFKVSGAGNGGATNPFRWELELPDGMKRSLTEPGAKPVKLSVGDVIEFNTGNGNHGVIFEGLNQTQFEQLFEVLPGSVPLSQDPGVGGGYGTAGVIPANTPLLNVRVKDTAQGEQEFFCSVHGTGMNGVVEFAKGPSTFKVSGAGNGGATNPFRWELELPDGTKRSLTEPGAKPVKLSVGDVIEFNTGNGNHGVIFEGLNQTQFEQLFEVLPGSVPLSQDPGVGGGYGTAGVAPANTPLLNVRVKDTAQGKQEFFCSVHGIGMNGVVEFANHVIDGVSKEGVNTWKIDGMEVENVDVKVGEIIEWRVKEGFHGLRFTSWARDRKHIAVIKDGDIGFMHLLGRNPTASKVENDVMLRVRIDDSDVGTEIPFSSLVHPSMKGKLTVVADSN